MFDCIFTNLTEAGRCDAVCTKWLTTNTTSRVTPSATQHLDSLVGTLLNIDKTGFHVDGSSGIYFNEQFPELNICFENINVICINMISAACSIGEFFTRADQMFVKGMTLYRHFKYDAVFRERYAFHLKEILIKLFMIFLMNSAMAASFSVGRQIVFNVLGNQINRFRIALYRGELSEREAAYARQSLDIAQQTLEYLQGSDLAVLMTQFVDTRLAVLDYESTREGLSESR